MTDELLDLLHLLKDLTARLKRGTVVLVPGGGIHDVGNGPVVVMPNGNIHQVEQLWDPIETHREQGDNDLVATWSFGTSMGAAIGLLWRERSGDTP